MERDKEITMHGMLGTAAPHSLLQQVLECVTKRVNPLHFLSWDHNATALQKAVALLNWTQLHVKVDLRCTDLIQGQHHTAYILQVLQVSWESRKEVRWYM